MYLRGLAPMLVPHQARLMQSDAFVSIDLNLFERDFLIKFTGVARTNNVYRLLTRRAVKFMGSKLKFEGLWENNFHFF